MSGQRTIGLANAVNEGSATGVWVVDEYQQYIRANQWPRFGAMTIEVLLLAGGGAGGQGDYNTNGSGGGAGGLLLNKIQISSGNYSVVVGAGAALGANGSNTTAFSLTAIGGGSGGVGSAGQAGGSGGGGSPGGAGTAGQGTTATGTSGAGYNTSGAEGGGGYGLDLATFRSGTFLGIAGGGGGSKRAVYYNPGGYLGNFGGGYGGWWDTGNETRGPANGSVNTGGGGGGNAGHPFPPSGYGGSGRVIIRYPGPSRATGGTISQATLNEINYTIHEFLASGTFTLNG